MNLAPDPLHCLHGHQDFGVRKQGFVCGCKTPNHTHCLQVNEHTHKHVYVLDELNRTLVGTFLIMCLQTSVKVASLIKKKKQPMPQVAHLAGLVYTKT